MDELDLVRALSRSVPEVDAGAESRALVRLTEHIAHGRSRGGAPRTSPWSLAAAAVTVSLIVVTAVTGPSLFRRDVSAAATLRELATVAAAQPFALEPGSYAYSASRESVIDASISLDGSAYEVRVDTVREIWKATNGSGRIVESSAEPRFLSPEDELAWAAAGSPPLAEASFSDERYGPGEFPGPDLSGLPSRPGDLRDAIVAGTVIDVEPGAKGLFHAVAKLLAERTVPADVRAALFEIVASIPGVTAITDIEDPLERSGVGIELGTDAGSTMLIFDPATSVLLAIVQVRADGEDIWTAYETTSIVSDIEERP
jgi:hypothetical protein